ncbi:uncharacterized protein K489DRAFT_156506 [Dissoconium aciculare CBS 342.82]|uniref:Uncharacterized protein n=1 Tax=Dissoconium aciculare CBS 342.82 TaxID=1314786 RepID=A0A6J3MEV1_9PEZI|nr:uncharacterized protein K489DRAFT_156506 [Dissoconium aciculare CBS 342.82]KAF1825392.1 hypothetical protein K489DRAFT_156506 [Dissoconium aciculare CBS 342.82]
MMGRLAPTPNVPSRLSLALSLPAALQSVLAPIPLPPGRSSQSFPSFLAAGEGLGGPRERMAVMTMMMAMVVMQGTFLIRCLPRSVWSVWCGWTPARRSSKEFNVVVTH